MWVRKPSEPVIVTSNGLAIVETQERVADPEPGSVLGLIGLQTSPDGGVLDSDTVPEKLFFAVTVIMDTAEVPTGTEPGEVACRVKSQKLNVAVAV